VATITLTIPDQYVTDYAAAYGEMLLTVDENNVRRPALPAEIKQALIRREKQILRDYMHKQAVLAVTPPGEVNIT
jgi:hypothetical protein